MCDQQNFKSKTVNTNIKLNIINDNQINGKLLQFFKINTICLNKFAFTIEDIK